MDRDNQAGKANVVGWIAGIIDGEGYIGLWKGRSKKWTSYVPIMSVSNTHYGTITYLSEQLKQFGVGNHISIRKVENPKWKQRMVLEIKGMKRIKKLINLIKDYSITKKTQILLLEEYIDYRLESPKNKRYGEYEESVFVKLKLLKHTLESSTTTR